MKKSILSISIWLTLFGVLTAGVQVFNVGPSTLADWQVNGAARDTLQGQDALRLPGGTELFRTFSGGAVILHSVSSPDFGSAPANWPILQVGVAALALTRDGDRGRLVLSVGDTVTTLPVDVPLDSSGRSVQPLELVLGYDSVAKVGVIAAGDQVLPFQSPVGGPRVEVSIAAGEDRPWSHDLLEISVISAGDEQDTVTVADTLTQAKPGTLLQAATNKLRQTGTRFFSGQDSARGDPKSAAAKQPTPGAVSTLEIYTPPAVRQSAAAVRTAMAQSQQK